MTRLMPWKRGEIEKAAPSTPFTQMRSDWDRLFDHFLDDLWGPSFAGGSNGMSLDVSENDDAIVVRAELPGVDPKDIDVNLSGDVLTIAGKKLEEQSEERARYHHSERRFGSFQRSIRLPIPVETEKVEAEHRNGVLKVTLRKAESVRPRKIEIRAS